jgi:ABC-type glycerol-3-phosphate transport system substrate-binding protein
MQSVNGAMKKIFVHLAMALITGWISACSGLADGQRTPAPFTTPTLSPVSVIGTTTLEARTVPTPTPMSATDPITLILWTTEDLASGTTPAGRILKSNLDSFTAANPNIHIEIVLKKPYGKGGLLDFLLTTNAILPSRLPDLVTLDLAEAPQALDVLKPLDTLMPSDWHNDLFPFAERASIVQNRWVIAPFAVDVQHLVFDRVSVRQPPQTWDDVLRQKQSLLMPIGGDDAFLLQYFALLPPNKSVSTTQFDVTATTQVLDFFKRAHDNGVIPDAAIGLKNEETWSPFAQGQVAMAQVSAWRFLTERDKTPNAAWAFVPTRDGRMAPTATGWGFAITARELLHQVAAARLVRWLTQQERLANWMRAARRLPAHRATLIAAIEPTDYAGFLWNELENAVLLPAPATYAKSAEAWRTLIPAVWKGQITPDEAARNIAAIK